MFPFSSLLASNLKNRVLRPRQLEISVSLRTLSQNFPRTKISPSFLVILPKSRKIKFILEILINLDYNTFVPSSWSPSPAWGVSESNRPPIGGGMLVDPCVISYLTKVPSARVHSGPGCVCLQLGPDSLPSRKM